MITIDEIRAVAAQVQLDNMVVEKDYALGWLLWGIHQHLALKDDWVFKGGTCLKKCYFETYRFSEDLDFSFRGSREPTVEQLIEIFSEVSERIFEESGVAFPKASIQFEVFQNPRGSVSIQGGIKYRGPVRPQVGLAQMQRIKIDLTLDEPLVLPPAIKQVEHPYSDRPENGVSILSYSYEEVFAEKVRALGQRLRPRDLYDVIHLHRRMDLAPDQEKVRATLESKCRLRSMAVPTLERLESHDNRAFLESEWETQLKHQIPILPGFDSFLSELPAVLDWVAGREEPQELGELTVGASGEEESEIVSVPVTEVAPPGSGGSHLDRIRFAAANRLVIRLGYNGEFRDIEPYALARSSEGDLLLRAIRYNSGEARTYRWDRIESVQVLTTSFTPRYLVEITSAGYLPVHQLTRRPDAGSGSQFSSGAQRHRGSIGSGPTYVFRCGICGKTFRRKSMDLNLNPHKHPQGFQCAGRVGTFVRTEY